MREERAARRTPSGAVSLSIQESARSGNLVLRAHGVSFGYPGAGPLIRRLETDIVRGDRVGILGPNGCGKTTLVRLLLGDGLAPDSGDIRRGANLEVVYSDQLRGLLRPDDTLADAVAEGREYVMVDGVRRHILGYLGDFLFAPERAGQKVSSLSGGERSRLLMAKLFAQPSNVLVLDEPTNDLDLDTVELLEENLDAYQGTVLVVSHDRTFLNEVVAYSLVFEKYDPVAEAWLGEDEGWSVNEYPGGYDDWMERRREKVRGSESPRGPGPESSRRATGGGERETKRRRLSYNEQRELDMLPGRIEALEKEIEELGAKLSDPGTFQPGAGTGKGAEAAGGATYKALAADVETLTRRLAEAEAELNAAYNRWGELEAL
jgi:ATP-binding cassette subfamily F protein uup